jgi:hypothetical protein
MSIAVTMSITEKGPSKKKRTIRIIIIELRSNELPYCLIALLPSAEDPGQQQEEKCPGGDPLPGRHPGVMLMQMRQSGYNNRKEKV